MKVTYRKFNTADGLQVIFYREGTDYSYKIIRKGMSRKPPIPADRMQQLVRISDRIALQLKNRHLKTS